MIPPTNGMQAIAAATFDGKPVDADFAVSGSGIKANIVAFQLID